MKQKTLAMAADAGAGFERYRKPTRRDEFLQTMEGIVLASNHKMLKFARQLGFKSRHNPGEADTLHIELQL